MFNIIKLTPWRNGSASDSRSEGCVFESRRGHKYFDSLSLVSHKMDDIKALVLGHLAISKIFFASNED